MLKKKKMFCSNATDLDFFFFNVFYRQIVNERSPPYKNKRKINISDEILVYNLFHVAVLRNGNTIYTTRVLLEVVII